MASDLDELARAQSLRMRALSRLTGQVDLDDTRANSSAALAVLHDLALSPATAADSLKLLHELQVHQVELDLQEEELRRAVVELEAALHRQMQLYEALPAACFTIRNSMELCSLNRSGALLLRSRKEDAIGRSFGSFLDPGSSKRLHNALTRVAQGAERAGCELRFPTHAGPDRIVHASVGADPSGHQYLIVCADLQEDGKSETH